MKAIEKHYAELERLQRKYTNLIIEAKEKFEKFFKEQSFEDVKGNVYSVRFMIFSYCSVAYIDKSISLIMGKDEVFSYYNTITGEYELSFKIYGTLRNSEDVLKNSILSMEYFIQNINLKELDGKNGPYNFIQYEDLSI